MKKSQSASRLFFFKVKNFVTFKVTSFVAKVLNSKTSRSTQQIQRGKKFQFSGRLVCSNLYTFMMACRCQPLKVKSLIGTLDPIFGDLLDRR